MIDKSKNLSIELSLSWTSDAVTYIDRYFLLKTNFWRDFYPPMLDYQIKRADLNQTVTVNYKAGELLLDETSSSNHKTIPLEKFNRTSNGPIPIQPAMGRFYPRGLIDGVAGCFKEDLRPFRIRNLNTDNLDIDLNHPLAEYPLQLSTTITDIFDASQQHGGRCNEIAELITLDGPGMQCLLAEKNTDYFHGMPFTRLIEEDDSSFYAPLESTDPVDLTALDELHQFYDRYLKDDMQVLDLMAGHSSRLSSQFTLNVTGLGLKESELKNNPQLKQYQLHDLNTQATLPFEDQQFDAIICSFAIEYITQPFKIFAEVARILKPGGTFMIGFSDRFFQQKTIAIWNDVHQFERMGIVLEYFRQSEQFNELHCESLRGKIRHEDDPFEAKNVYSCPLFMLKGTKSI